MSPKIDEICLVFHKIAPEIAVFTLLRSEHLRVQYIS